MYAELFDQLGRSRNAAGNSTVETPPIVAFKAGVIHLEERQEGDNNGESSFTCTADTTARGQVRLIRNPTNSDELKWQFYDRRRDSVVETEIIPPGTTFDKVQHGGTTAATNNRIFVWTRPASTSIYKMYWMQDADDTEDDEIIKTVNETLQSATATNPTTTTAATNQRSNANNRSATNADPQVDTLSSILENLGMPAPIATPVGTTTANQLTLADLQGAMAGIQEQQQQLQQQSQAVDLSEIITSEAITELLEDEAVVHRLLPFLPENQQSVEHLRDNLLSPSVRRSLVLLSQALADDSYGSVIANFQLDPVAGQDQLIRGNPIAAFLDCITASVQQEEDEEDSTKDEEMKEEDKEEEKDDAAE